MGHKPEVHTDERTGRKYTRYEGFACQCGEKGKQEMESLHAFVRETFYKDHKTGVQLDVRVTQYLYILAGNYNASVESIPLDPGGWGALIVQGGPKEDGLDCYVQWDHVEDGFAEVIKAFYDKYGKTLKGADFDDETD